FSLMIYLARRGHDDELIELALRHHPFGQFAAGDDKRRMRQLLDKAGKIREKADRLEAAKAWDDELLLNELGTPRDCLVNGTIALRADPDLVGRLVFDEHRGAVMCANLPWNLGSSWREWTNTDDLRLAEWMQHRCIPLKPATCA